jgi:hypothetical protein
MRPRYRLFFKEVPVRPRLSPFLGGGTVADNFLRPITKAQFAIDVTERRIRLGHISF